MNKENLDCTKQDDSSVTYIYTAYITTRSGKRIYAKAYGLGAFRIPIRADRK